MDPPLPVIPAKRYFTIGEVGDLCGVKPHVLRYWEQEFSQLRPMKRRGNRRYYQHHEVLMIRRIRELLYDQGFTISGARNKLQEQPVLGSDRALADEMDTGNHATAVPDTLAVNLRHLTDHRADLDWHALRVELMEIRQLLTALDFD